jgi:hypothetical protein
MRALRLKKGAVVKILHSPYAGVSVGELGKVDCQYTDKATKEPGYGVEFEKVWPQTYINEKFEKRVMWFPLDAVEYVPPSVLKAAIVQTKKK